MTLARTLAATACVLMGFLCLSPLSEAGGRSTYDAPPPAASQIPFTYGTDRVIVVMDGSVNIRRSDLKAYVDDAAQAVIKIYGRLPVPLTIVRVEVTNGDSVGFATSTYLDESDYGLIELSLGRDTSRASLNKSWTLTHELLHLGFPIVEKSKRWLAEGIATYEEPVARVRTGMTSAEEMWADLIKNAPSGLPQRDQGLNYTRSWGRVYWGGALYCLLADIEIRKQTRNKFGLEHALRGIARSGGTAASDWNARQAIDAGDQALNLTVLQDLYTKMALNPGSIDLHQLWSQLGIIESNGGITFDDSAPLASIRKAIENGS